MLGMLLFALASVARAGPWSDVALDPMTRQLALTVVLAGVLILLLMGALARLGRARAQTRNALRAALSEGNTVLAALPGLVSLKDPEGGYLSCNDAFGELFDCDIAGLMGKRDIDLVDRDTARRWHIADRAAITAGQSTVSEEWLALPQKGFTALLQITRKPVYDGDGRLTGILSIGHDVTDQHRSENERDKRASYQRALLDNFPFQVWFKDTEGRILAANQAYADAAGAAHPGELIRKTDRDISPPAVAEAHIAEDRHVMVTRRKHDAEKLVELNGRQTWLETYKAPVIDDRNKLLGTVGFARDITERRVTEQALRDSELRFRTFFDNHSAILLFIDPGAGVIVDANDAAAAFYGYPRNTLGGMPTIRIDTLDAAQAAEHHRQIVDGTQTHFEFEHRLADGELRNVDVYSSAVEIDAKQLLLSIVHDITERVRSRRAMEQEHELFSSGPVVVFSWGPGSDWPVRYVSANCEDVIGYTAAELMAEGFRYSSLIHPEDLQPLREQVDKNLARRIHRFELSYRLQKKHQGYIWVREFTHAVRHHDGGVEGYRGYVVDQSETKQLEISLADERRRLQNAIKGTHAATWEWNVQTGETRFNERWAEIIGYRLNELVPITIDTWTTHTHPDDLAHSTMLLERHFAGESTYYECEVRMRHKDGHWVWVLDRGQVSEWTGDGQPLWMHGTHVDITARKQTELQARANENRLRTAGLASYEAMYEWDIAKQRLDWFSDIYEMLGHGKDEATNNLDAWLALIHPDDRAAFEQAIEEHARRTGPFEHRYRVQHRNGTYRYWLDRAVVVLDDHGQPQKWIGVCTDVTERQQAEERQRLAVTVFQSTHEGILVTDANAHIIDVNEAFTQITGYSRDEALGKNPNFLSSGRQDKAFYENLYRELATSGKWTGEIWNRRKDGRVYAEKLSISTIRDDNGKVQRYVALFSDITTLKEQQTQLERIAYYDALTDLPNRVMLGDRLSHAMRHVDRNGSLLAVVYLDLDGFKEINDTHGHDVGDQVLVTLAARMQNALRSDDTLSRLGGDEFVAILGGLHEPADCIELLPRLLEAAARPIDLGEHHVRISASLGVALYPQASSLDPDQLLRQADQAMYQAKLAGKNRYHFFDTEHDQSIRGQVEQVAEIRTALDSNQFVLHYQPKVNMRSGEVVGVEALIRWPQANGSVRGPIEFLPLIEDNELASRLDEWVIDQALTQVEHWQTDNLQITVSVNVSAYHLQQADFVDRLAGLLAAHPDVDPAKLTIEVLETTALMDLVRMSEVIRTAQAMGVVFALDDFGTGFSSLDYLKNLPARQLKIDRGFVRDMLDDRDDLAILEGIVGLASAFRRDVVAEGVESAEHGEILLLLGCETAQGFGIGRPMPADQLQAWIGGWQPHPSWRQQKRMSRDDLPLVFAMVEHRSWVKALQSQLNGKQLPMPEMDERQSLFGSWLDHDGQQRYGDYPEFARIRTLHSRIHALAPCLLEGNGHDHPDTELIEILGLRDALVDELKSLMRSAAA